MTETAVYAVAGHPVLHSLGPGLFAAGFRAAGIAGQYTRLAVENAAQIRRLAAALDLAGLNITSPFKETILPFLDEIDPDARKIGAVNTVIRRDGRLIGWNTDPDGAVRALTARGLDVSGRSVLVLGAGGAGRAAVFGMRRAGARVVLVNRTPERAESASKELGCAWLGPEKTAAAAADAEIIVSCRSTDERPFDPGLLRPDHVVLDARYQGSRLADEAAARGAVVVPGREWLLHQAAAGFTLFTGEPAPVEEMRKAAARFQPERRSKAIALAGFMGAGKSAVGRILAQRGNRRFADVDALVEAAAGETVADIFARRGEAAFRIMERAVIRGLDDDPETVIALGGGSVLDPEIRAVLKDRAMTFWVYADPVESAARLAEGSRPLLEKTRSPGEIAALFKARVPAYAAAADAVIVNGGQPADLERAARRIENETRCVFPA
ncbi:MAG: shikimate kinase [Acidobacteriota bacterium]|nr:shikimate kinase [Acidobacteriota bacterium]